ncbi:apolipoprotein N-acyltransferase [Roseibium denhamense]|uniref:Apolipoprotein N-acyltransferase n=1 Tax=Roseibium denhamense TaxID=76305 RepID=A0ABY1PLN5_9HYPH|nr:apolipoprotein N-acyltransferase [Roseibium denhamense]MTI06934.1 apolipoprotein N-acyltransferase [Roseibium denhamense]SMP36733.1 Apolipoprotein N-acyltransferase [Roseibium denhamense]
MQLVAQYLSVVPNTFLLAWGWRRRCLCCLSGALAAAALPPLGALFVLPLAFAGLVWLLDGALDAGSHSRFARFRVGFGIGWLFGFGYFLASLWWIGSAFLVEADKFAWLMPFAVVLMPTGLALFTGLGVGAAAAVWSDRFSRILVLAATVTLADWTRGHVLTGFPWNAFGYTVSDSLLLSQIASVIGIYGMSFLVIAIASALALLADAKPLRARIVPVLAALGVLGSLYGFGFVRLAMLPAAFSELDIRIVQPSIDQKDKWRPDLRDQIFQTYLHMSEAPLSGEARVGQQRLIVWPESAVPFLLTQEPGALYRIGNTLGPASSLALGAIRTEPGADGPEYFNSIYVIGSGGTIEGLYDKVRLVPFGEYVPLKSLLDSFGISNLAGPGSGFQAGYQPRLLSTSEGFSFLPLICYEVIFPGPVRAGAGDPGFILNVTNDAWFGRTPGPYQHLAQARIRSIETGLPLVRAANTGISAIVDGRGVIQQSLGIFERGVIDGRVPLRLGQTIYGTFGDVPIVIISIGLVIFAYSSRRNRDSRVN